jgi:hypothetical protein
MRELEPNGQDKSDHQVDEGFALPHHISVCRLIVQSDDNGAVLADTFGLLLLHGTSSRQAACARAMKNVTACSHGIGAMI